MKRSFIGQNLLFWRINVTTGNIFRLCFKIQIDPQMNHTLLTKLRKVLSLLQILFKVLCGKAPQTLLIDNMLFHTLLI